MRVLFSPVSGFPLQQSQTKDVFPRGAAEGDASADFEGVFRSFMAGIQADQKGKDILSEFLSGISGKESENDVAASLFADGDAALLASLRGAFSNCLLQAERMSETDAVEQNLSSSSESQEALSQESLSAWSNPWQWIFPFSFQDIVSKTPLTTGGNEVTEGALPEDERKEDSEEEGIISDDPILAYLASLDPGTPIILDFSFSFEEQSAFLDGGGMVSPGKVVPDPSMQTAVPLCETGGENVSESEETYPLTERFSGGTEFDPEQIRGMSFYRSFSASRMLRILPDAVGPRTETDEVPEEPDTDGTANANETSERSATPQEEGASLPPAVPVTSGGTKDVPSGQTRASDSGNPVDLREAIFETLGLNTRSRGGNDASLAGEKRGQSQRGDFSERSDALQRLIGHVDSAIQNGQNGGNLSFRSVMRDVLSPGIPLMTQDSGAIGEGVTDVVRFLNVEGESRASIVVEPPALGRVDIELSQTASGIEASLKVNSEQLRQYIQDQTALIRNMLQQQGVALTEFSVDVRDMTQRDGSGHEGQRRRARVTGVEDPETSEDAPAFRIDLEQGLLFWVA